MGQHQHDIDELARMERICLELAAGAAMPEERAGLEIMAGNYRAEILDIKSGNAFGSATDARRFSKERLGGRAMSSARGKLRSGRAKILVVRTVVIAPKRKEKRDESTRLTGHPFRQSIRSGSVGRAFSGR
jgi:hypothetical protein